MFFSKYSAKIRKINKNKSSVTISLIASTLKKRLLIDKEHLTTRSCAVLELLNISHTLPQRMELPSCNGNADIQICIFSELLLLLENVFLVKSHIVAPGFDHYCTFSQL